MTDPIADMLTRIRNALAVNKAEVSIPHSNLKETILAQLLKLGFIVGVKTEGELTTKKLVVTLRSESQPARISSLSRIDEGASVRVVPSSRARRVFVTTPSGSKVTYF